MHYYYTGLQHRLCRVHRLGLHNGCYFFANNKAPDGLALVRRRAPTEHVSALLFHTLVRLDEVAEHLRVRLGDDARIDVRARTQIVEDTGGDGGGDEVEGLFALRNACMIS